MRKAKRLGSDMDAWSFYFKHVFFKIIFVIKMAMAMFRLENVHHACFLPVIQLLTAQ
jgi:hypothetical protein